MGLTSIILAGGESRRMGIDKLKLRVEGRAIIEMIASTLREVSDEVYISVNSRERGEELVGMCDCDSYIIDEASGCRGPLLGIASSLKQVNTKWVLFVPGDTPWVTAATLAKYIRLCVANNADICVPYWDNGYVETLFQLHLRETTMGICEEICGLGKRRASDPLRGVRKTLYIPISEITEDPTEFTNINTPTDIERRTPRGYLGPPRYVMVDGEPKDLYWRASRLNEAKAYLEESLRYEALGLTHIALHAAIDAEHLDPSYSARVQELSKKLKYP